MTVSNPFEKNVKYILTRNTCIVETREARGGGEAHKMSGMEEGERIGVNCVAWEDGFQHWL